MSTYYFFLTPLPVFSHLIREHTEDIFERVAHSLEPGEMLSNSASHKVPNFVQHSQIQQKKMK